MPSNIAEGFRRNSKKEKSQFLRIAYASGAELETQLEISSDLGFLLQEEFVQLSYELDEIMKMMNRSITAVERQI